MTSATLQKKICMLGGFSVGKTSLQRYVQSVFSEMYVDIVRVYIDISRLDLVDLQQSVRLLFRQLPEYPSPPLHL